MPTKKVIILATNTMQLDKLPLEAHELVEVLTKKIDQLEAEKVQLLQKRNLELECHVQQRIQKLQSELEERSELLVRERLARESAEAANRLKDEFLSILSHEIRTPLNAIMGWAKILQCGNSSEVTIQGGLEIIERNAKAQMRIIEDLLDVSRIIRGKLNLDIHTLNLNSVVQSAIDTIRPAIAAKEINFKTALDSSVCWVSGDFNRLQQIVWNLLSNATKFTSPGGEITIRLEAIEQENFQQALITVSDTGQGINANFLPYVFDRFRQYDSTTTRQHSGLGLGLAIVRHLVELHGGTVGVESPGEGQGATFTVSLPLVQAQEVAIEGCDFLDPDFSLDNIRILLVEDDVDSREFIAYVLQQYGARVRAFAEAGEALAAFIQSKPDLLLSDIGLPGMDGYMLMRSIRKFESENGGIVPAIALTAFASEYDQKQALAAGFQMHISKPVEPVLLANAIATLVQVI